MKDMSLERHNCYYCGGIGTLFYSRRTRSYRIECLRCGSATKEVKTKYVAELQWLANQVSEPTTLSTATDKPWTKGQEVREKTDEY